MKTIRKMTITKIKQKKSKDKIVMLTAYDYLMASILDKAEVDIILVGDSVGTVLLGYDTTIPVTLENMIYHTTIVSRAVSYSLVVADMPFLSYNINKEKTLFNAGKLIQEAGANAVKVEGGSEIIEHIKTLINRGIPVMGHLGLTPQSINKFGSYAVQGRTQKDYTKIIDDALILQEAGVFSLVLECVPKELAKEITKKLDIPVIGIGAGLFCDGQVLVTQDLLGFFEKFKPKFVKQYKKLYSEIFEGISNFKNDVKSSKYPDTDHSF
jgi:3-methyl-2-oxobutanoate hydroxymethyltransferase